MEDQKDISKHGYKDDSPYKDRPYLDIYTPNGVIDMTDVSIPLLANNVLLQPNSGLHKFNSDKVREIPMAQEGEETKGVLDFLTNPIRKRIADNLYPVGYHADYNKQDNEYGPLKKVWEAIKGDEGKDWERLNKEGHDTNLYLAKDIAERTDLLQLLMGQPQKYNTIGISDYKPTKGKDKNVTYYTSKLTEDEIRSKLGYRSYDNIQDAMFANQSHSLGRFKLDKGEDERGKYISYYDIWDLHPWKKDYNNNKTLHNITNKLQKLLGVTPPEIYGRIYMDDNKSVEPQSKVTIGGIRLNKKKYGGSVKQSLYNKEKLALKNQDGIIADMMDNGAFLPKFKMGAEKKIETSEGEYTIKKDFDKGKNLPYINYSDNNIDDRVYYSKDDDDDSGNFQIINIAQQIYDQKREHEKTKELITSYRNGENLSYSALKHLSLLGVISEEDVTTLFKDPIIEKLKTPPISNPEITFENLDVSSNVKNVTLGDDNTIPIDDQIALYMAHVSGAAEGTEYSNKLKKIYDKLNRVYYKDSKKAGLDIIEYMKSLTNN